ncbi:Autophagocytosis associated protein active-site domain-containing protein [Phytophthora infestans]|uniref:Ubiquitin-like-conjugating enzyme ATG10 n=1 Tax=Phytophthora infestans TaxID=4787 RepID=A0A8S9UIC6_PHYIN|nr:Autophagocytosis associated protein active-site domain-containing protein [Phytophthora infestans]
MGAAPQPRQGSVSATCRPLRRTELREVLPGGRAAAEVVARSGERAGRGGYEAHGDLGVETRQPTGLIFDAMLMHLDGDSYLVSTGNVRQLGRDEDEKSGKELTGDIDELLLDEEGIMTADDEAHTTLQSPDVETALLEFHIAYHTIYQIPVLYFRAVSVDGRPLPLYSIIQDVEFPGSNGALKRMNVKGNKTVRGIGKSGVIMNIYIIELNRHVVWGGDARLQQRQHDHQQHLDRPRQGFSCGSSNARVTKKAGVATMTVSNSDFDGNTDYSSTCDGHHYWTFLFYGRNTGVSMFNNYVHGTSGRSPKLGGNKNEHIVAHIANNY